MKDVHDNTKRRVGGVGQDMQNITFGHVYSQEMTTALLQVVL